MALNESRSRAAATMNRRNFVRAGATVAFLGGASRLVRFGSPEPTNGAISADLEWRNRQSNMAYRRLGRTGMMISEVISGRDPITLDNYTHLGWLSTWV